MHRSPHDSPRRRAPLAVVFTGLAAAVSIQGLAAAAHPAPTQDAPLRGPRRVDPRWHALVGGTLIPEPGQRLENATIVVRDGVIVSVEVGGEAPEGARAWDCEGLVIHAGFLEPHVGVAAPKPGADAFGNHWQTDLVVPHRSALDGDRLTDSVAKDLRSLGFTAAAIAPEDGVLRGTAAIVALGSGRSDTEAASREVLMDDAYQALAFRTASWGSDGRLAYPTSEMGAIALVRQAFLDAERYDVCMDVYREAPEGHEPPQPNRAMEAISQAGSEDPLLFVSRNELQSLRAARLAAELGRSLMILGSGTEFRRLNAIAELGLPMIVPVSFPEAPDVSTAQKAASASLRDLWSWEEAPSNVARLMDAGVTVALTTNGLEKRSSFAKNLRQAMERGFDETSALAALTTTPARLLGVDDRLGRVEPGLLAHLVVREGEPFAKDGKVRDVWVGGKRFEIAKKSMPKLDGSYAFEIGSLGSGADVTGDVIIRDRKTLSFAVGDQSIEAKKVKFGPLHVHFHLLGKDIDGGIDGVYMGSGLFQGDSIQGTLAAPDGSSQFWTATRTGDAPPTEGKDGADEEEGPETEAVAEAEAGEEAAEEESETAEPDEASNERRDLPIPFGAYGRHGLPEQRSVVFRGATVWTSAEAGIVEGATVVVEDGMIRYVGPHEFAPTPDGAEEFDAS
ncbi:MAG: amidohydrolase family protein, partial [Planctomycetota bacterium]